MGSSDTPRPASRTRASGDRDAGVDFSKTLRHAERGPSLRAVRSAALELLADFLPRAGRRYAVERNYDYGTRNRSNVSLLSPYLRHRLILEEEVLRAVLREHGRTAADKFVEEVFWRAYFKGWMEQRPAVWRRYTLDLDHCVMALGEDAALRGRYDKAVEGRTGIDCFDAWSNELIETGYLHNHARMWFASIWVFTLALPWQLGADFFLRHLLDGDPASNTLSWRWVCGLHTVGKTYLARASNIAKYTSRRFDPEGQLAAEAAPLSESEPLERVPLQVADQMPTGASFGLLVTEEDCSPESLGVHGTPAALLGLVATDARSPLPASKSAKAFASAAVADACERGARHFDVASVERTTQDWAAALTEWARASDIDTIVTAMPAQGPVNDRLAAAAPALAASGLPLVRLRRRYDALTWPHATRGFFRLKTKIPELLEQIAA